MLAHNSSHRQAVVLALFALSSLPFAGSGAVASPSYQTPPPTPLIAANPRLLTDPVPDPRQPGVMWFPATGHTIRGAFLEYWNRYGGLAQFGYPLTEEFFEEPQTAQGLYRVQYFERSRFEHHPENKGTPYEVLLGALGRDFHEPDPPATALPEASYFPETGHNLGGVFREYWHEHGGLFVHGYPITEPQMERSTDGKDYLVQWFERSRFEWHPENKGTEHEVLLGLLGVQLARERGYPYGWYPHYGYAPNYSWFAGYYKADHRKCAPCGCSTIRYEHYDNRYFSGSGEVLAYIFYPRFANYRPPTSRYFPLGESQDERLTPTSEPKHFLVVFGRLDDPSDLGTTQLGAPCLSPKFRVDTIQFNPAR